MDGFVDCRTADEVRANAIAVRKRFNALIKPVRPVEDLAELVEIVSRAPPPLCNPVALVANGIRAVQIIVAEAYGVSVLDMTSARRTANVVRPRQVAMYICKMVTGKSLPEIGRRFGNRDHTTVLHAVRKISALAENDPDLAARIEDIKTTMRA